MFGIKRNSEFFNRSGLLNISHVPQRPGARIADLWPILNALIKALDKKVTSMFRPSDYNV